MQGLKDVTLSFASEADFTPGLLQPLRDLKRLQSLTLDNRGAVQPTILNLEVLRATSITAIRMKGCLLCAACGLGRLTQLRSVELHQCILMLVCPSFSPWQAAGNLTLSSLRSVSTICCDLRKRHPCQMRSKISPV